MQQGRRGMVGVDGQIFVNTRIDTNVDKHMGLIIPKGILSKKEKLWDDSQVHPVIFFNPYLRKRSFEMISEKLLNVCRHMHFPLDDRNASLSWLWDGKGLALWHQAIDFFGEGPYPVLHLKDHDVLHELCHWLVATDEERSFPEYGLDWGISVSQALGPMDGNYRDRDGRILCSEDFSNSSFCLLNKQEADLREFTTQYLTVRLGKHWDLDPVLLGEEDWFGCKFWETYEIFKMDQNKQTDPETHNQALRLAEGFFQNLL